MGISRLTYNLSLHDQLPSAFKRVHHRFRTPYIAIILFCLISIALLIPGLFAPAFFSDLGALYVFGSLLCFALAHAAILGLRVRKPEMPRPFKLGLNIKVRGRDLPLTAILGLAATLTVWIIILVTQPFSRWAGFIWMIVGLIIYFAYRLVKGKTKLHSLPNDNKFNNG
jgi:APA family basic amino acid/polyamine antiporter